MENLEETIEMKEIQNEPSEEKDTLSEVSEVSELRELCQNLEEVKTQQTSQLALQETALETERTINTELREEIEKILTEKAETQEKVAEVTKQMTEKVEVTDQYIRDLLAQLQEGQERYDQLQTERCIYCPWTWINRFTKEPNWVYGVVGLILIIGGSRVIYH